MPPRLGRIGAGALNGVLWLVLIYSLLLMIAPACQPPAHPVEVGVGPPISFTIALGFLAVLGEIRGLKNEPEGLEQPEKRS